MMIDNYAVHDLCVAIVADCIDEWKELVEKRKASFAYDGVRVFLRSDWGYAVCDEAGVDSTCLLNRLEEIRANAEKKFIEELLF